MWPIPSNRVPTSPISVARNSSCQTILFLPTTPPVGGAGNSQDEDAGAEERHARLVVSPQPIGLARFHQLDGCEHLLRRYPVGGAARPPDPTATATRVGPIGVSAAIVHSVARAIAVTVARDKLKRRWLNIDPPFACLGHGAGL